MPELLEHTVEERLCQKIDLALKVIEETEADLKDDTYLEKFASEAAKMDVRQLRDTKILDFLEKHLKAELERSLKQTIN